VGRKSVEVPTGITPFAKLLGIEGIGDLNTAAKTYVVEAIPANAVANFFGTVHGGYLQGVLDGSAGMLIFLLNGTNSAITIEAEPVQMCRAPRLNQPLIFTLRVTEEDETDITVIGQVHNAAGTLVAHNSSKWKKRARRR